MIKVNFEEGKQALCLRMEGHAGQAPEGMDLVCAAASILAYTAAQTAGYMLCGGKLKQEPFLRLEKGDVCIRVCPREEFYREALHAFTVLQVGFSLLAKNYPQFLRLSMFGHAAAF